MSPTTHVLCGDVLLAPLSASGLEGEKLVWREAMVDGPHGDASATSEQRIDLRVRHLAGEYGTNPVQARLDLGRMERALDEALLADDEIVLWFEDDLFCQVHLWYLLWRAMSHSRVSVVSSRIPFAELAARELQERFAQRVHIGESKRKECASLWLAFVSPDPRALEPMMTAGVGPTSFSSVAVRLHLERFPWTTDGLGRIERTLLRWLETGCDRFGDLFRRTLADEAGYGFGDSQIWASLVRLAAAPDRPIAIHGVDVEQALAHGKLRDARFELTDAGAAALKGRASKRVTPRHLGGVDLSLHPYRWDPDGAHVVAPD